MTRLQIYRTLWKQTNLSEERNPAVSENKIAKFFVGFGFLFMLGYLIMFGVLMGFIANEEDSYYATEFLAMGLPLISAIDFMFRFVGQQTPSQNVKPYLLLPMPRKVCIEFFLIRVTLNWGNLIWMALFIPYAIIAIVFTEGFWAMIGFLLAMQAMILLNSQWYLFVRTLLQRNIFWWALPICVYAAILALMIFQGEPWLMGFKLTEVLCWFGVDSANFGLLSWCLIFALLATYFYINLKQQFKLVYKEVLNQEKPTKVKEHNYSMLQRFGEVGQYMKLELLMLQRCKNVRKTFITGSVFVVLIPLLMAFTDVYDGFYMSYFWLIYCFDCYGAMMLVKVMCYEGNYIDLLMVHREKLIALLRAKYIFYASLTVIPIIPMLIVAWAGKMNVLMVLAMAVFTAGVQNALFMLLVPVNKQTMPLNTKLVGKGGMESNYLQLLAEMITFAAPLLFITIITSFFPDWVCALVFAAAGVIVFMTQDWWLGKVYKAFIKVKYRNLESLRATR